MDLSPQGFRLGTDIQIEAEASEGQHPQHEHTPGGIAQAQRERCGQAIVNQSDILYKPVQLGREAGRQSFLRP